jgi:ABC-type polysaccharide/polyol phosphate export permease
MAEIRLERERKRGLGWLWALLLVLIIAAVVWYLWSKGYIGGSAAGARPDTTRTGMIPTSPPLAALRLLGAHALSLAA